MFYFAYATATLGLLVLSLIGPTTHWLAPSPATAGAPTNPNFGSPDGYIYLNQTNGYRVNTTAVGWGLTLVDDTDVDYFNISVEQGNIYVTVELYFNTSEVDADLYLWAPNGTLLASSNYTGAKEVVTWYANTKENFTIAVDSFENYTAFAPYTLVVGADDVYDYPEINDMSEYEANFFNWSGREIKHVWENLTVELSGTGGSLPVSEIAAGFYNNLFLARGDTDFYRILLFPGNTVDFYLTAANDPLVMGAYSPTGVRLQDTYSGGTSFSLNSQITTAGYYYIGVLGENYYTTNMTVNDTGFYSLDCRYHEDAYERNLSGKPNNIAADAVNITQVNAHGGFRAEYYGLLASNTYPDWYVLNLTAAQTIEITITFFHVLSNFDVYFYLNQTTAINQVPLYWSNQSASDTESIGRLRLQENSTYYLLINSSGADRRIYNMTLNIGGIDDEFEENDEFISPLVLPNIDATYDELFSLKNDEDFFGVPLLEGDQLTARINFNRTLGNLDLYLFNHLGALLASSTSDVDSFDEITWEAQTSSLYVLWVHGINTTFSWLGVEYVLDIDISAFDDAFEENDAWQTPVPIAEGNWTNLIIRDGDDDWYEFYLAQGDIVVIHAAFNLQPEESEEGSEPGEFTDADLKVFFETATSVPIAASVTGEDQEHLEFTASQTGDYLLGVLFFAGPNTNYSLFIDIIETDDIYEDNDNIAEATFLDVTGETRFEDLLIRTLDEDWYKIYVDKGYGVYASIEFDSLQGNLDFYLISENLTTLASNETADLNLKEFLSNEIVVGGWYYIQVIQRDGTHNTYDLTIDIGPFSELVAKYPDIPPAPTGEYDFPPEEGEDTIFGVPTVIVISGGVGGLALGGGGFILYKKGKLKFPFRRGGGGS